MPLTRIGVEPRRMLTGIVFAMLDGQQTISCTVSCAALDKLAPGRAGYMDKFNAHRVLIEDIASRLFEQRDGRHPYSIRIDLSDIESREVW